MAYNIPIGNWTNHIKKTVHDKITQNYIVNSEGAPDPAYGCYKNFTSTYQCGNGPTKTVNILGDKIEAGGQSALFDCSEENKVCKDIKLTLKDDGNLVLTDHLNTILWQSNTKSTGLALDKYKAANGKYGRNYLLAGETLKSGEFIGSPSGNCYLMMIKNTKDCTQNGLQLLYQKTNCSTDDLKNKFGSSSEANGLYTIKKNNIKNVGKVGYIDETQTIHEYPPEMVTYGTSYTFLGNYDSTGKTISTNDNTDLDKCQTNCNSNAECSGFVLDNNTCFLKDSSMFPSGIRNPSKTAQLYIRDKEVKNNATCSKIVDPSYASMWDSMPTGDKMSMDTLCGLGAFTQNELINVEKQGSNLLNYANTMQNKLNNLINEKQDITNTYNTNNNKFNNDIKNYENMYKNINKNSTLFDNITAMSKDTKTNMSSQKIKFFLWTNLAIIIAIISIRILRN